MFNLFADVTDPCLPTYHVAANSDFADDELELDWNGRRIWVEYEKWSKGEVCEITARNGEVLRLRLIKVVNLDAGEFAAMTEVENGAISARCMRLASFD